jgi:hypothetical protein
LRDGSFFEANAFSVTPYNLKLENTPNPDPLQKVYRFILSHPSGESIEFYGTLNFNPDGSVNGKVSYGRFPNNDQQRIELWGKPKP